jgi:hypothetical protein
MDYENYFSDFGLRCFDLLKPAKSLIKNKKRDVTVRLCVMSAALTIPHEVLVGIDDLQHQKTSSRHPSGTTLVYPKAASHYHEKLTNENFMESLGAGGSWHMGAQPLKWAENWPELKNTAPPHSPMQNTIKVQDVLTILRNALAHGNIGMYAENKIIKTMIFLSVVKFGDLPKSGEGLTKGTLVKFNYLHTGVGDFALFMEKWKQFLLHLRRLDKPSF